MDIKTTLNNDSSVYEFYKKNDTDTIWWVQKSDHIGERLFSFNKKKCII